MRKNILLAALLVVIAVAGYFIVNKIERMSLLEALFPQQELQIDKTANVLTGMREMATLYSACYYGEMTLVRHKKNGLVDNVVGDALSSLLGRGDKGLIQDEVCLIVSGRVRAGYDLTLLKEDDIHVSGDTITVVLPEVKILQVTVNPSDVEVFVEDGKWSHKEITELKSHARKHLIADATKAGILTKASDSGTRLLTGMLKSFGFKEVIIEP